MPVFWTVLQHEEGIPSSCFFGFTGIIDKRGEMEHRLRVKTSLSNQKLRKTILIPTRVEREEFLDLGAGSARDVRQNLGQMQRINDWFGGTRALFSHLLPRLARHNSRVTLLDLGTGMAGIPAALIRWGRRRGVEIRIFGIDRSRRIIDTTRRDIASIDLLQADARDLPFLPGSVDYVISSLFLHHLSPIELSDTLCQSYHLARKSVIMSDLVRGWLPWVAFHLIQPVVAPNHLTRRDGLLSILRAYTPAELFEIAHLAVDENQPVHPPLPADVRVYSHWPWRMTLVVDK
jgi:hypothetical protein